jgi:phosphoglycerate dehydrogenase-like enzyme
MSRFRVGLSRSFIKENGNPVYPDFDLSRLEQDSRVELVKMKNGAEISQEDVRELDALILLAEKFTRASILPNGRLTLIARFGVGFDAVDVAAATEHGIGVAITPDGVRRPVAVSVLALLLALTCKVFEKDRLARMGPSGFAQRSGYMGMGLVGRTMGLVGLGNIGAETIKLAKPLDMRFIAYDPYVSSAVAANLNITMVNDVDAIFRESDFVSLHCPLTAETTHLVNERRIELMKPSSYLINTARGGLVDQKALTRALQARRIAGAGLDVLDPEPPAIDDAILKLDNVIVSPHALCHTDQCFAGIGESDIAAVFAVMTGTPPVGLVDKAVVEHTTWKSKLASYKKTLSV